MSNRKSPRIAQCTVCNHPERARIEMLRVGGASLDALAEQFKVGRDAIHRHCHNHVSERRRASLMAGPAKIEELTTMAAEESRSLLDYLKLVRSITFGTFLVAAEAGDRTGVANIGGRLLDVLDHIGRLTGELRHYSAVTINQNIAITTDPRMLALQRGLLGVVRNHPAARAEIVALLRGLDAGDEVVGPVNGNRPPLIECEAVDAP